MTSLPIASRERPPHAPPPSAPGTDRRDIRMGERPTARFSMVAVKIISVAQADRSSGLGLVSFVRVVETALVGVKDLVAGPVSLNWPHRDGLMWPHLRHARVLL